MQRARGFAAGLLVDLVCGSSALIVEDIADYELRTFRGKQARLGCALSARPAGNQSHLAFQSVHSINLLAPQLRLSFVIGTPSPSRYANR